MRKALHIFLSLILFFVYGNTYSQTGYSNGGNTYIHNNGFQFIDSDFFNLADVNFTIDGTLWLLGNITNHGNVNFSDSTAFPRSVKLEGKAIQIISGNGITEFYNVLFKNKNLNGFILEQSINIRNDADFSFGIIEIPSNENKVIFSSQAGVLNVSSTCFVDGWVRKIGDSGFIFPIGDNGYYRFAAISAPSNEQDQFLAKYTNANPSDNGMDNSLHDSEITNVSDREFWEIKNEVGYSNPDITLSWDINSTSRFIPDNPDLVRIVRWNGEKWINEGNKSWQGDSSKGAITSSVSGYGFFTLATIANNFPVATTDIFYATDSNPIQGNLLLNDFDPDDQMLTAISDTIVNSEWGTLIVYTNGDFNFTPTSEKFGMVEFNYTVCDDFNPPACSIGTIVIYVDDNADGDNIPDYFDIDDDNDGITDVEEGDGLIDTDNDGIPDSKDQDSDNDGIPDVIEGHILLDGNSFTLIYPSGKDTDSDGLDDAFDPDNGGNPAVLADHDFDGTPDWRDNDDDDDGILSEIEITNNRNNPLSIDTNKDGIPDYLDPVSPVIYINDDLEYTLSGVAVTVFPLENDSPDFIATSLEIIGQASHGIIINNNNGSIIYTPDNDFVGTEIIAYEVCTESGVCRSAIIEIEVSEGLFIPEIITPNGDGKNDFFVIPGIERFNNTHLIIFNRWGNKVYESTNYENDWAGFYNQNNLIGSGKLPAGTYYYILRYDTKEPLTGFVYLEF